MKQEWIKLFPDTPNNGDMVFIAIKGKHIHIACAVQTNNQLFFQLVISKKLINAEIVVFWCPIIIPELPIEGWA